MVREVQTSGYIPLSAKMLKSEICFYMGERMTCAFHVKL